RRSEEPQPPPLKEDVPAEEVLLEEVSPEEVPAEEVSPEAAPFYDEPPARRGTWLGRIPKRLVFIGLGIVVEGVIILILLTCWPDKEQKQSPGAHATQRGR